MIEYLRRYLADPESPDQYSPVFVDFSIPVGPTGPMGPTGPKGETGVTSHQHLYNWSGDDNISGNSVGFANFGTGSIANSAADVGVPIPFNGNIIAISAITKTIQINNNLVITPAYGISGTIIPGLSLIIPRDIQPGQFQNTGNAIVQAGESLCIRISNSGPGVSARILAITFLYEYTFLKIGAHS